MVHVPLSVAPCTHFCTFTARAFVLWCGTPRQLIQEESHASSHTTSRSQGLAIILGLVADHAPLSIVANRNCDGTRL